MKSGCHIADQINTLEIVGNIIPHLWYKNITFSSGKPHFVAIALLADIIYWYRPTMIRDDSGMIIGAKTKFKADMLQKSYQAFADTYGFTKRQVKDAVDFLVDHHLLVREFRTISTSSLILNNVMYVQPIVENVKRIMDERCNVADLVSICPQGTTERIMISTSKEGLSQPDEGAPFLEEGTYTESTSKNSSKNEQQQQSTCECPLIFFNDNGFGRLGSHMKEKIKAWCESLSESLVVEAMKRAVEQGKHYWSYVDAILVKWEQMNVRDVKDAKMKEFQFMFEKVHKRKLYSTGRKLIRTEKLPDWFTDEGEGVQETNDEEFEAEKAKLMAELKEYRERRGGVVG